MQKIVYKFLLIILCIFWGVGILSFITGTFQRKFIYPIKYSNYVDENCENYGLKRSLVYGIIKAESGFNPNAKSSKGAKGLMQITQSTADFIAEKLKVDDYDIFSPETNIRFGCWYLSYLFMRFSDERTVISAYNAGEGRVTEWLENKEYSLDGIRLANIPFNETQKYVSKVVKYSNKYDEFYNLK